MSAGALAARLTLDANGFKTEMLGASAVSDRELKKIQRQVQFVNDYIKEMAKSQREVGVASADVGKASAHMEEFGFKTAGAKRELLVLAHELSQGNYSRFGGSLLVLGERTGAASLLFSAMGLAVLGAAAAIGGFALALIKGHAEQDAFNKSLLVTGGYAGLTATAFDSMARAIGVSSGQSLGKAKEALQELVDTGQFGPRVIGQIGTAIELLAKNTGQNSDEIVKDFAKMNDGVAKWAKEHNDRFNFITLAQYDYIKKLEEQGKAEEAELVVAKALTDHLKGELAPNLGYLQRLWKSLGETASESWDAMKGLGKAATVDDEIAKQAGRLEAIRAGRGAKPLLGNSGLPKFDFDSAEAAASSDLRLAKMAKAHQEDAVAAVAQSAADNKRAIAASDYLDKLDKQKKGQQGLTQALKEYDRELAAFQAKGGQRSAAQIASDKAELRRQFMGKAKPADPLGAIRDGQGQVKNDFLRTEIASYQELADAEAKAAEAAKKLSDEQSKSFNKWFQEFNEKDIARNMPQGEAIQSSIGKYLRDIGDQSKAAEQLVTGAFSRMEDALVNFVHTGHLSFKDLFTFMADEYLRNQIRMQEKKLLDSAGNFDWSSALTKVGSWFSGWGEHADGLAYVPSNGYPAILHEGERVMTKQDNVRASSGGAAIHIDNSGQTINVGQGVSRGEVAAAVQQGNAQSEQRIRRLLHNGNIGS